VKKNLT